MKRYIGRGLFLVAAMGVTSLAIAAWQEPRMKVLSVDNRISPEPANMPAQVQVSPDQDLLLFLFSLSLGR
jgi:hypothetical protein